MFLFWAKTRKKEKEIPAGFINQIWIHLFLGSNSVQIWSGFSNSLHCLCCRYASEERDYIKGHHCFIVRSVSGCGDTLTSDW